MTEVYEGKDGQWYYRIKGDNGEIMAWSEGYTTEAGARRGLQDLLAEIKEKEDEVS